ncbi:MAG TPA: hypothetical protein VFQ70_04340 [Candidatus Saccharimonadaceae bacterium]|nr:hypothetical protein [Candidatus Saccharimonadaceae bacterium]
MQELNTIGTTFREHLLAAEHAKHARERASDASEKIHVVGAGATLTAAYEQLRNAAENAEEHVLLQRAVVRFLRRLFLSRDRDRVRRTGEELAVELTQAGYIANDSVADVAVDQIDQLAERYYDAFLHLASAHSAGAETWTLHVLAAEIENILQPDEVSRVFVQVVHQYFAAKIADGTVFKNGAIPKDSDTALYVAIHRSLLKSDPALIRLGLLKRFALSPGDQHYIALNEEIDKLMVSSTTDMLQHYVDRRGAVWRVLDRMMVERDDLTELMEHRDAFLDAFEGQVTGEYERIEKKVDRGVMRSLIFLIITKVLIGVAIEVPYDKVVSGGIMWTPLLINLLFPPIYMVMLRTTMRMPGRANTIHLTNEIERVLYEDSGAKQLHRRRAQNFGSAYELAYGAAFILVFGGVALLLWLAFGFSWLHLIIFFVFLSAASFLGFRLSRMIRELEAIESNQNGLTALRDFLYMPFVVVGRWISDSYSKVNIITMILDMMIELPLKTVLRLVRQWSAFISGKQDEL